MRGIADRLDRERFEIVILSARAVLRGLQSGLSPNGLNFAVFDNALARAIRQIHAAACDLIYYWEVGSDALNYFLPFARLAPVQCTSHGSMITTGIPAIDYFYSSGLMETGTADDHYSERCGDRIRC